MNRSPAGIMNDAVRSFRLGMKNNSSETLRDNYYLLLPTAQNAKAECRQFKRRFGKNRFIDKLFNRCMEICKGGKLPDEEKIIASFNSDINSLTAEYLPLCLTCALTEYAARGVRSKDGEELLSEAVRSLRRMGETDFGRISRALSETESILMNDRFYSLSDEKTKAFYRACISRRSRATGIGEKELAEEAIGRAQSNSEHVGKYIIPTVKRKKRGILLIIMQFVMPFAACVSSGILLRDPVAAAATFFPFYVIFRIPAEQAMMRGVAPERLPRLRKNSSEVQKTGVLLTVSTLMPSPEKVRELSRHLEKLYLSNKTEGLTVCCLADFKGAASPVKSEDKTSVKVMCEAIEKLNKKYPDSFIFALRPRVFSKTQGEFTGRERKMGAISDLVKAVRGNEKGFSVICGNKKRLREMKYIFALDADSVPEFDCAAELISVAEHPMNRPVISKTLGRVTKGFGIIVPRSENRIDYEKTTVFERIMSGANGKSTYENLSAEKYRDLFGESIFCGKGLIDIEAYYELMKNLPEETILSHDIIESGYLRAALAGDVTVSDSFPKSADSFFTRLDRWVRGDWQNLRFVFGRNPLNALSRYKLFDNVLRSMLRPFCVASLVASLAAGETSGTVTAGLSLFALCADDVYAAVNSVLHGGWKTVSRYYYSSAVPYTVLCFVRAFFSLAFSVRESAVCVAAAFKAVWRMKVTRKKLLEWVPAANGKASAQSKAVSCILPLAAAAVFFFLGSPFYRLISVFLLFDIPLFFLTSTARRRKSNSVSAENRETLLSYAAATWRFFDELCGKENNYLPPDNIQLSPVNSVARRTSPTNIGLMLLSFLAARDLGFISSKELHRRLESSLGSVDMLEKYKGNLLNWYSTKDCVALEPRYVSAVDSGNFVCCLVALKEGIAEYVGECPELIKTALKIGSIIENTDLSVMYNDRRKLFHIGINPDTEERSGSFYDLFMSEARMTAYYAVATRTVDKKSWSALGRIYVGQGRHAGLVSWTGTMFEYFMPSLFLPSPKGSISHESLRFCLDCQRRKAGRNPFGVSESGFYAFDGSLNYQYKAHGAEKLSLSRISDSENVVSPYSSFLTTAVAPDLSVRNLKKLEKFGMLGRYGFYEAIDFTKSRVNGEYAVISSFMAHHQGMSLVAAVNALKENRMQKRFMRSPEMMGAETLLDEKVKTDAPIFKDMRLKTPQYKKAKTEGTDRIYKDPSPVLPNAAVYSNSSLTVCITDCGSGFSIINGIDATVRDTDILRSPKGVFAVFSNEEMRISVSRALSSEGKYTAEFRRKYALHISEYKNIRFSMKTAVLSDKNCEIRTFRLENKSGKPVSGKMTVCFEPCLDKTDAFASHPAYSKLFLKDRWDEENKCFVFSRSKKNGFSCAVAAGFADGNGFRHCSDKEKALITPHGIFSLGIRDDLTEKTGNPDCFCCFEADITLGAGESTEKTMIIAADDSEESAITAFVTARNPEARKSFSQTHFRNDSLDSAVAACVVPAVLYPKSRRSGANAEGCCVNDLWSFGISGDLPIVTVKIEKEEDVSKLAPYIRVNKELRSVGIANDLVIAHSIDEGYNSGVAVQVRKLLFQENCELMLGIKGGVHVINLRRFSLKQASALMAFSSFAVNLGKFLPNETKRQFRPLRMLPEPSAAKNEKNSNSVKRYSFTDGKISIENRGETVDIPWNMVYANKSFGTMVSDKVLGFTWAINSRENRLTPWINNSAEDNRGEMLIWKYNGVFYDILALSQAVFTPQKAVWRSEAAGVCFTVSAEIPEKGMTKKISVEIRNDSGLIKDGELFYYTEPVLGFSRNENAVFSFRKTENGAVIGREAPHVSGYMSVLCSEKAELSCFSRSDFFEGRFSESESCSSDNCIAVGRKISLAAGGKIKTEFFLSWSASEKFALLMPRVSVFGQRVLNPIKLNSDDEKLNVFFNSFLYSQVKQSRFFGKTGFWQSSGAYGFRDQLQDSLAFLICEPRITRTHLLRCAAVQFPEGDVLHWWHMTVKRGPIIRGIRTKCSDDMLWLPFVCCEYVRNTDDYGVLNVQIPYLEAENLLKTEKERYVCPQKSKKTGTLLEHCMKSIEKACTFGKNGLPLIGSCDWNDGFSNIGTTEGGESVWLGMFLIIVLEKFSALCKKIGLDAKAEEYSETADRLRSTIENKAWQGDRYARAIMPDGSFLGETDDFIDILPQAFAVFSGLKNAKKAIETAINKLVDTENRVIRLLAPPFDEAQTESVGYIASYPAGIRENAGQYTHAAVWLAMACFSLGDNERGEKLIGLINPMGFYECEKLAERYRAEPFVLAGDVSYSDGCVSRAGWTHFTGSAAWFYRCIAENYAEKISLTNETPNIRTNDICKVFGNYKLTQSRKKTQSGSNFSNKEEKN